jgi:hypothetical protein
MKEIQRFEKKKEAKIEFSLEPTYCYKGYVSPSFGGSLRDGFPPPKRGT